MPANWSLILNVLLLIGVIIAIGRLMKARRHNLNYERFQPNLGTVEQRSYDARPMGDDIIAVRKVQPDASLTTHTEEFFMEPQKASPQVAPPQLVPVEKPLEAKVIPPVVSVSKITKPLPPTVMMFLLAKENRQFVGYDLLQTVLSSGLRFGEGHLFHRHQAVNGQGAISCSLAAATATGVFDLQNIGAFSVRGLCLFMHTSSDSQVNAERFSIMLETARQLSDGLDAHLLDDQRKPLSAERVALYYKTLDIAQEEHQYATASA